MTTNQKKDVAIVFGFSNEYVFAVACVMINLKKTTPNWISEVVIFHDGISEKEKNLLNKIFPCRFIKYDFPVKNSPLFDKKTISYFSKMVFSKYECLRLLEDYKNVVWLDYDIVITKDISQLSDYCDSGIKMMFPGCKVREQLHEPIKDYDMELLGICASTFVLQDHLLNYMDMYNFCYEKTEKYAKYLKLPEQGIFDFMIQEFKLKVDIIDSNMYSVHPRELDKIQMAKIIHSAGQAKFWNEINNELWNDFYDRWLKMGGTKYNINKYKLKKNLKIVLEKTGVYEKIKKVLLKLKIK